MVRCLFVRLWLLLEICHTVDNDNAASEYEEKLINNVVVKTKQTEHKINDTRSSDKQCNIKCSSKALLVPSGVQPLSTRKAYGNLQQLLEWLALRTRRLQYSLRFP